MALAEGLCSHLNPPPAPPATAAERRSVCRYSTAVVFVSVAGLQPLGSPSSRAGCCDSSRQQQAAGPGPPSGLPLSGTSCVCTQQLPLPSLHGMFFAFFPFSLHPVNNHFFAPFFMAIMTLLGHNIPTVQWFSV